MGDIVDTLDAYCKDNDVDVHKTYFWICCLCVNQHRVAQSLQEGSKGLSMPTEIFLKTFGFRVTTIGHLVCLLSPFKDPLYLKRIWCVYEISRALATPNCKVDVVCAPQQIARMKQYMDQGIPGEIWIMDQKDRIHDAICKINVKNASASQESDKDEILRWIEAHATGGCEGTNERVRSLFQAKFDTLCEEIFQFE